MSTRGPTHPDERETSYGGVVVRGDETIVITPTGKSVIGLPKAGDGLLFSLYHVPHLRTASMREKLTVTKVTLSVFATCGAIGDAAEGETAKRHRAPLHIFIRHRVAGEGASAATARFACRNSR